MHLTEEEAQVVLQEYKGRQREVETVLTVSMIHLPSFVATGMSVLAGDKLLNFTYSGAGQLDGHLIHPNMLVCHVLQPYVVRPPSTPHPAASSISARLVIEMGVLVSIISATVAALGGFIARIALSAAGALRYMAVNVLWPLVLPILRPVYTLTVNIAGGLWDLLVAVLTGQKGPGWLVAEGYRMWKSGVILSSARTLGAIVFVIVAMAALAKFTLTRRPKDFTKWVS